MGIDMSNYKVVYKDKVWNCININPIIDTSNREDINVGELQVLVLDEKNKIKIIRDNGDEFQFLKI